MNLKQLDTFLALSKIRNFTKTADYLHYAQSNVTAQIQQLEAELKVQLFERIGKNIVLTSEGEKLVPYASKMLALSSEIKDIYSGPLHTQRLMIGASESLSTYKLPKILKEYRKNYPNVELFLKLLDISDVTQLLADNTIDIAFLLEAPLRSSSTVTAFAKEEPLCVLATNEHPLASKQNVTIEDFDGSPMILTHQNCCYRKCFESELSSASVKPKVILETGSIQIIKETALNGLGLCLLPEFTVHKELENHSISRISYAADYHISAQLIYHKDKWVSPQLAAFIMTVQNCY